MRIVRLESSKKVVILEGERMGKGKVQAYYGYGKGKTPAVFGYAIHEASRGGNSIIIQFLKGKDDDEISFIKRLEP